MADTEDYNQWSTLADLISSESLKWPEEDQVRVKAYEKYDQMYWNDPTQYAIRVLEAERPLYIPNARVIVNTTAYYLTKGLQIQLGKGKTDERQKFLDNLLKRETFYSTYNLLKQTTIARGDGAFHVLADPLKKEGERISIEIVHPGNVYQVWDDDDHVVRVDIAYIWEDPDLVDDDARGEDPEKIRVLRYTKGLDDEDKSDGLVYSEELVYNKSDDWWDDETTPDRVLVEATPLDARITQIPIYWFKNIDWGDQYGSSELRGLEIIQSSISQGATDTQAALGLEGLGVYATDGGRPVDDEGKESEWEVSPGKVMEVPQGSYFRRVEGVGSITPMMEQIKYLESKINLASGTSDVATGNIDVAVAESGIALAIKFIPTLAKLEFRDQAFGDKLTQMFYDLKAWFAVYESQDWDDVEINVSWDDDKLPVDRKARLNELNNMFDRGIITKKYYRTEAAKLGYEFPPDEDFHDQFVEEWTLEALKPLINQMMSQLLPGISNDAPGDDGDEGDELPPESNPDNGKPEETKKENGSNNKSRVNESAGTEA